MADSTLTKELRIELKFLTDGFKRQTQQASNGLKKLDTGFKKTAKSAEKAKNKSNGFVTALKGYISLRVGGVLLENALAFDRVANRMKFATTSLQDFNKQMELSKDTANSFGLALIPTQRGLATLQASAKGTKLAGREIEELFKGISQASGALSLTADETNSVFLAFSQIISKGKVQAEELRGQIGERIPGALKLAERALGVTGVELDKLLQKGALLSEDLLPKLSREFQKTFGPQAEKNASSLTAQVNKFNNEVKTVSDGLFKWVLANSAIVLSIKKLSEGIESDAVFDSEQRKAFALLPKQVDILTTKFNSGLITISEYNEELRKLAGFSTSLKDSIKLTKDEVIEFNKEIETLTGFEARGDFSKRKFTSRSTLAGNQERLKDQLKLVEESQRKADELRLTVFNGFNTGFNAIAKGSKRVVQEFGKIAKPVDNFVNAQEQARQAQVETQKILLQQGIAKEKQLKQDKDSIEALKERLEVLKKQEQALQGGGQVNFLEAVQRGSAESIRVNIQARARAQGAGRGNQKLLEENLQEQKITNEKLEELIENVKVERA